MKGCGPMAFKVILTPLSGVGHDAATLATASSIARAFGGEVDAVFATPDVTQAIPTMGEGVSGLVVEQIINAAEHELQQRRVRARRAFEASGFAPTAWREHPGKEEAVVETLGRLADLIVLPNQAAAKDEIE